MQSVVLALGASGGWGLGDFLSGLKSRGLPVLTVTLVNPFVTLVMACIVLRARLARAQQAGVIGALAGIALIAAG